MDSEFMSHSSLGFRFLPTKYEILFHLRRKSQNPDYRHPAILEADVYAQQPEGLPWYPAMNYLFHGKERYFFHSKPLISSGKKTSRTVGDAGYIIGVWHGNSGTKPVHAPGRHSIAGYVRNFTFFVKDNDNGGKDKKTNWIMHEFVINKDAKQQWALCRIRFNSKDDPLFTSSTSEFLGFASNVEAEDADGSDDDIPLPEPPSKQRKTVPLNWNRNEKNLSCCCCHH